MATENKTDKPKSDLVEVGAFWKKVKDGKTFLSGKVKLGDKEYTAFIFPNKKGKDTHPDYRLSLAAYEDGTTSEQSAPAASGGDEDIPF